MLIADQPITWLRFNPCRRGQVRIGEERGLRWHSKWAGCECQMSRLSISVTADFLGFVPTTISGGYRKWTQKEKKHCFFIGVRGQRRMATVAQITTAQNQGMQKSIREHTRTGNRVYFSHSFTKTLRRISIFAVTFRWFRWSEIGMNNTKAWIHSALHQRSRRFLQPTCWPCPSLYENSGLSSDGHFMQDNAPCHTAQITSTCFLEHGDRFCTPVTSTVTSFQPTEQLWAEVEREIRIIEVWLRQFWRQKGSNFYYHGAPIKVAGGG